MLEVLNSPFIHIVLPEKSTKCLNQEVDLVIVMLVHFSIMNTFHQKIKKNFNASKVQQHNNKATLTTIKNN